MGADVRQDEPPNAGRLWVAILGAVAAASALLYAVWPYRGWVMLALTGILFAWLLRTGARDATERKRIGAIIVLFVAAPPLIRSIYRLRAARAAGVAGLTGKGLA